MAKNKILTDTIDKLEQILLNDGLYLKQDEKSDTTVIKKKSLKDIITSEKYGTLFKTVNEQYVVATIQPQIVLVNNLFQKINVNQNRDILKLRVFGNLRAKPIAEGTLAHQVELESSNLGYEIQLDLIRYGLALAITDEALAKDDWGIVKFWLREGANALARTMEDQAYQIIVEQGVVLYDNFNTAASVFGACTGRGITGAQNGTASFNDMLNVFNYLQMRGYSVDTIIIHPFAWRVWALDPQVKEVLLNGAVIISGKTPMGDPFPGFGKLFNGLGYNTEATKNVFTTELEEFGATFRTNPVGVPVGANFKIIVTSRVPFNTASISYNGNALGVKAYTDVIFADSARVGIIGMKGGPQIRNWNDIARRANFWEISQEWGFGILDQGNAIGIMKNVIVDREYNFENVNQVQLADIDSDTNFSV